MVIEWSHFSSWLIIRNRELQWNKKNKLLHSSAVPFLIFLAFLLWTHLYKAKITNNEDVRLLYMVLPLCSWKFHVLSCSIVVWIKHLWGKFCQHLLLNKVYWSKYYFKITLYVCFLLLSYKPPLSCWSSSIEKFTKSRDLDFALLLPIVWLFWSEADAIVQVAQWHLQI